MKNTFVILLLSFILLPMFAHASDRFEVAPAVIDEKALARDIITKTITVTNITGAKLDVYAFVNNIDSETGEQEFLTRPDVVLKDSLANWIQIKRNSVELMPGESYEYEVKIFVNLNAEPGNYHAEINFMYGSTRAWAEEHMAQGASTVVNVEVTEDIKERLQLGAFTSGAQFFSGPEVSFTYDLENIGNKELIPKGEVRIYDRKGREVGAVPANVEGVTIAPDETGQIASAWTATKRFGKFKALLDIEYGSSQLGTVNDTIYFWIIPWKLLAVLFVTLASIVGGLTYYWWDRYEKRHQPAYVREREQRRFARHTDSLYVDSRPLLRDGRGNAQSEHHVMDMRKQ